MSMFSLRGLTAAAASFNNTVWKRLVFASKPLDPAGMVGIDGVITLSEPGWYHIHAQGYWAPPLVEISCYTTICDALTGEILSVGNDENPSGQHPSVPVSSMVYSDGTRRIEIKGCWISTASGDKSAVHTMQTGGNYVYAFGYKVN